MDPSSEPAIQILMQPIASKNKQCVAASGLKKYIRPIAPGDSHVDLSTGNQEGGAVYKANLGDKSHMTIGPSARFYMFDAFNLGLILVCRQIPSLNRQDGLDDVGEW